MHIQVARSISTPAIWNLARFSCLLGLFVLAVLLVRPYPGSWNDASRLATIESLVDHRTFSIDQSIYQSTGDKLLIDGRYYSDKPPVLAMLLAPVYAIWQGVTGETASTNPAGFCRLMVFVGVGLPTILAMTVFFNLLRRLSFSPLEVCVCVISMAMGTTVIAYQQSLNQHLPLFVIGMMIVDWMVRYRIQNAPTMPSTWSLIGLGTLVGLGYTLDQGCGPILCIAVGIYILRIASIRLTMIVVIAALPWVLLHHAVNYAIGGSLSPANANPAYLNWPGSSFGASNMTGVFHHHSWSAMLSYAAELLVGKKGFLGHNLPLFLVGYAYIRLRSNAQYRWKAGLDFAMLWSVGTFGMYALFSNNASGGCISVRWFVPLIAPGFLMIALLLQHDRRWWTPFLILTLGGLYYGSWMIVKGPWTLRMLPGYWIAQAITIVSVLIGLGFEFRRRKTLNPMIANSTSTDKLAA